MLRNVFNNKSSQSLQQSKNRKEKNEGRENYEKKNCRTNVQQEASGNSERYRIIFNTQINKIKKINVEHHKKIENLQRIM